MTARRQASTTSLSKYARATSPDLSNRNADFCNSFWGVEDVGVEVLFARMRGAARTIDEFRAYTKERVAIEEDYAKRLSKLSKVALGRDEIGELRTSLDTLRTETEKQASFHLQLAQQIRTDIEGTASDFSSKQSQFKKTYQAAIEKEFKAKQTQEGYVKRAREKYEGDCLRINNYTAQATLVQGKDLEKIQMKLERAQQTVQANEKDFANFARAFQDTVGKWEQDWKAFCDSCQDLEEERIDFMKDTIWALANAVSTVCVSDDESCERIRLALEQMEPEKDIIRFVRVYGTGNLIPDPPAFVDYNSPNASMMSSSQPTTHIANFQRVSHKSNGMVRQPMTAAEPEEEPPSVNNAGFGVPPRESVDEISTGRASSLSRTSTRAGTNSQQGLARSGTTRSRKSPPTDSFDPTEIKIGGRSYPVDPHSDPQEPTPGLGSSMTRKNTVVRPGDESDPLTMAMENLNAGFSSPTKNGSQGRSTRQGTHNTQGSMSSNLQPPMSANSGSSPKNGTDRDESVRRSAEFIVGGPPQSGLSASPTGIPTANFFPPQHRTVSSASDMPVEQVVGEYGQAFPGERRLSTAGRRNSFINVPGQNGPNSSGSQGSGRPVSREGHAGIGANGRSPSPQPISRATSPALVGRGINMALPVSSTNGSPYAAVHPTGNYGHANSVPRSKSPNPVGIAIDRTGRVAVDDMADHYRQPMPSQPTQSSLTRQPTHHIPQPPPQMAPARQNTGAVPQPSHGYPGGYQQQQQQQQPPPPPPPQQSYTPAPPHNSQNYGVYPNPPSAPYYSQSPQQNPYGPPPGGNNYYGNRAHNNSDYNQSYAQNRSPSPQPPPPPPPQPQPQPPAQMPSPTGAYAEDGRPILFYVKALYDYQATIEEEFDFQAGDIIAVTATPEDGWWSGELLDEARRRPQRHIFPSNFVVLF